MRLSLKQPRKPHVREKSGTHFFNFFCKRGKIFEWSIQSAVNFSSWVDPMDLILHNWIVLNVLNNLVTISHMLDHSKTTKNHFWMIQIAKNEVFGHVLEFGLSGQLDIALSDRNKHSKIFGAHAGSFKNVKHLFLNDQMSQKWHFWPFSWVLSVGSTWYCIFWWKKAMFPSHEGSFKSHH